jgi:hypothetical protein
VPCNDQYGFLHSSAKERWLFGGNRSGKTETAVTDCLLLCIGEHPVWSESHPPPVHVWFCAPSWQDNLVGVVLKKIREMVRRKDLVKSGFDRAWMAGAGQFKFKNQSLITFKSANQSLTTWGGQDLDAAYVDEHIPISYYRELKMRLIDRAGFMVNSMTPELGSVMWERRHTLDHSDDPNCKTWFFSVYGNPHLLPAGLEEVERTVGTDENLRQVKFFGKFVALSGLVYPMWQRGVHVVKDREFPAEWQRGVLIDPHLKKDTAIIWVAWTPEGEMVVYRCAKIFLNPDEIKKFIRVKSQGEKIGVWIADEAMGGEKKDLWGNDSIVKQLRSGDDGLPFLGTNQASDKVFDAGIMRVREALTPDPVSKTPNLTVSDACQGVIDEIEEYQFIPMTTADERTFRERVRKVFDDYMDLLRYAVMATPRNVRGDGKPAICVAHKPRNIYSGVN